MCRHGGTYTVGDGTTLMSTVRPLDLGALGLKASQVAVGKYHTCVVFLDGRVNCWGKNNYGQVGDGTLTNRLSSLGLPLSVPETGSVLSLAISSDSNCVITTALTIRCWGRNDVGELGRGDLMNPVQSYTSSIPIPFGTTDTPLQIAGSQFAYDKTHFCSRFSNKRVRCWGRGFAGQLGLGLQRDVGGQASDMSSLGFISFMEPSAEVEQIALGPSVSCALFAVGRIRCWGSGPNLATSSGSIGLAPSDMTSLPFITFAYTLTIFQVSVGEGFICAAFSPGKLICWGGNYNQQCGYSGGDSSNPSGRGFVGFSDTFLMTSVSAGQAITCATFSNERIRCWGDGYDGKLGIDSSPWQYLPNAYLKAFNFALTILTPPAGFTTGGDVITLFGNGMFFSSNATVNISASSTTVGCPTSPVSVSPLVSNLTSRTFAIPSWTCGAGKYLVSTSQEGSIFTNALDIHFFLPGFSVLAISPLSGSVSGGTTVTITGSLMMATPATVCRVGSLVALLVVLSPVAATCLTPPSANSSSYAIDISLNGINYTSSGINFQYFNISSARLSPQRGPSSGGTILTAELNVTGLQFSSCQPMLRLSFPSNSIMLLVSGNLVNNTITTFGSSVRFLMPDVSSLGIAVFPATFAVFLSMNNGGDWADFGLSFEYYAQLFIVSVTPSSVPSGVLMTLTLKGSNFIPRPTTLTYNLSNSQNFSSSATFEPLTGFLLSNLSVPLVSGWASVEASLNNMQFSSSGGAGFSIFIPTLISPTSGPQSGGTPITIAGSGFTQSVSLVVRFGSSVVPASWVSNSRIVCLTPASVLVGPSLVFVSSDGDSFSVSPLTYIFYSLVQVSALVPPTGPAGVVVTLMGVFPSLPTLAARCRFGTSSEPALEASVSFIKCPFPNGVGSLQVSVAMNGVDFEPSHRFFDGIEAYALEPALGPSRGGTDVIVSGVGFSTSISTWRCRYGDISVSAQALSSVQMKCKSPPNLLSPAAKVNIGVSYDNVFFTNGSTSVFQYYPDPIVGSILPFAGATTGGLIVTVIGSGFVPQVGKPVNCRFGVAATVTAIVISPTQLTCQAPAGSGTAKVEVSLNDLDYTTNGHVFSYVAVDKLEPSMGSFPGGTSVTLSGTGFSLGSSFRCLFGTVASLSVTRIDGARISCVAPPLMVDVSVARIPVTTLLSVNGGADYASGPTYIYYAPPTITFMGRISGPSAGGTNVTISGSRFPFGEAGLDVQCRFDTSPSAGVVSIVDGNKVTCLAPPGAGLVNLRLTFNGGVADAVFAGLFSYFKVMGISPPRGPSSGGTTVTLTGDGFVGGATYSCQVAGWPSSGNLVTATRINDQTIVCILPVYSPALTVDGILFAVTSDMFVFGAASSAFTLYPPPLITAIEPSSVPSTGGVVKVYGFAFSNTTSCRFGPSGFSLSNGTYATSATSMTCAAPSGGKADNISIFSSGNAVQFHPSAPGVAFSYTSCAPGTFSERDTDACQLCPPGTFTDQFGARKCLPCSSLEFSSGEGNSRCTPCPEFTRALGGGASNKEACVCAENYHHKDGKPGERCERCPDGGYCSGGTTRAAAKPGHWMSPSDPLAFLPCSPPSSCPGGGPASCAEGYSGRMCSQCLKGWYRTSGSCGHCPKGSAALVFVFFVVAALLVALLLFFAGSNRKKAFGFAGTLGVATQFFQVLSIVTKLDFSWPGSVKDAARIVTSLFTLKLDIVAPECTAPSVTYVSKWSFMMMVPFFFAVPFAIVYLTGAVVPRFARLKAKAMNAYLTLLMLGYMTLANTALEPFGCKLEVDRTFTLVSDPSLACFDPWWHRMLPVAVLFSSLYVVGVPAGVLLWLMRNRGKITEANRRFESYYGSLFLSYRHTIPFWGAAVMLENILIASTGLFLNQFVPLQIVAMLAIFIMSISVYSNLQPFVRPSNNVLQVRLRGCLIAILLAGMIFYVGRGASATWLAAATEFVAVALIMAGIVLIVGTVMAGLRSDRQRAKVSLPAIATELLCPRGLVLVNIWLSSAPSPYSLEESESERNSAPLTAAGGLDMIPNASDVHIAGRFTSLLEKVPCDPGDLLPHPIEQADVILALFSFGVFRRDLLPQLRARVLDDAVFRGDFIYCFRSLGLHLLSNGLWRDRDSIDLRDLPPTGDTTTSSRSEDQDNLDIAMSLLRALYPAQLLTSTTVLDDSLGLWALHTFFITRPHTDSLSSTEGSADITGLMENRINISDSSDSSDGQATASGHPTKGLFDGMFKLF